MTGRLILFMFAGRRANMEVQMPYLMRILRDRPEAELHLWDLTRTPEDQEYLRTLAGRESGRVRVLDHLHQGHPIRCTYYHGRRLRGHPICTCMIHKPPYEEPYKWYASMALSENTIFVKVDDDVLFLETNKFDDLIAPLADHPNRVISAAVVNNAVCAKYMPMGPVVANKFMVGDPTLSKNDRRWWALHESPEFARASHGWFLNRMTSGANPDFAQVTYQRTRPGEAVSINCIAFNQQTMKRLAKSFAHEPRLGDEGAVDRMLPWICLSFRAAHLSFGPQEKAMAEQELAGLRTAYTDLRKAYLT